MEISFIIPLLDRLDVTRPCLESLRETIPPGLAHEILLVDDGSTDGTREWAARQPAPPFSALFNERRLGYAAANNRAARVARGRLLALVNNDLVFTRGWLEPMLRALARPAIGIVGNRQVRVADGALDHAGIIIGVKAKPEHLDRSQRRPLRPFGFSERHAVTGACCLLRRELFLGIGGFDEGFRNGGEDVDLCYRIRARGLRVVVANRSVIRHHVSATPGRKDRDEHNSRRLCRKWREALIHDGARSWPHAYLVEHWLEPRDYDTRLLWTAFLGRLGVIRRPTREVLALVERNLMREEARWADILGPETSD